MRSACDEASGIKSVGAFNKKNITFQIGRAHV